MAWGETVARAIDLGSRWFSASEEGMGRPTTRRLSTDIGETVVPGRYLLAARPAVPASRRLSCARARRRVALSPMHVVVVGCGRVGSELATALERDGHSVSVIDKNRHAFRRLPTHFRGKAV